MGCSVCCTRSHGYGYPKADCPCTPTLIQSPHTWGLVSLALPTLVLVSSAY